MQDESVPSRMSSSPLLSCLASPSCLPVHRQLLTGLMQAHQSLHLHCQRQGSTPCMLAHVEELTGLVQVQAGLQLQCTRQGSSPGEFHQKSKLISKAHDWLVQVQTRLLLQLQRGRTAWQQRLLTWQP